LELKRAILSAAAGKPTLSPEAARFLIRKERDPDGRLKLGAANRVEAVAMALRNNLVG